MSATGELSTLIRHSDIPTRRFWNYRIDGLHGPAPAGWSLDGTGCPTSLSSGNCKEEAVEKELNRLAQEGYELSSTTQPTAPDAKSSPTTVHLILKRTVKLPE